MSSPNAFFLWIGSNLPDISRISILSAAEAGFKVILYVDRPQAIDHPNLCLVDWREIQLPWSPEEVRIKGQNQRCYAAFSDLFRFALLSRYDGWWFDCDTIILRAASDFSALLEENTITIGEESKDVLNGAVLASMGRRQSRYLYEAALHQFPILSRWGVVGPALITRMVKECNVSAKIVQQEYFYPIHHSDIAQVYLPEYCDALCAQEDRWYCLSLWGEVLSRSGLKYLVPPPGSYLANLLARHPSLGQIKGDNTEMARFLADNLHRLDDINSGKRALGTLIRKAALRLIPKRA